MRAGLSARRSEILGGDTGPQEPSPWPGTEGETEPGVCDDSLSPLEGARTRAIGGSWETGGGAGMY
eukprot:4965090-Pyramimonas_sp.AAC.1